MRFLSLLAILLFASTGVSQQYYSQPQYQTQYSQPQIYSQPVYSAQSYSYAQPAQYSYAQPSYSQPQAVYSSEPVYSQTAYSQSYAQPQTSYSYAQPQYAQGGGYGLRTRRTAYASPSLRQYDSVAQQKAQYAANNLIRGHCGGGMGGARFEGVGWSNGSAQEAIANCCGAGGNGRGRYRPAIGIGVAKGRDGYWYACRLAN